MRSEISRYQTIGHRPGAPHKTRSKRLGGRSQAAQCIPAFEIGFRLPISGLERGRRSWLAIEGLTATYTLGPASKERPSLPR